MSGSFGKINYQIRPCKQIERKLIIEGLKSLRKYNINIESYLYVGFGSIYFYDFILFHKYLHIENMICIECEDIENRMIFNKPYDFIELYMGDFSNYLSMLNDRKMPVIMWLDFDGKLDYQDLQKISNFASTCTPGTIIIISVNANTNSYKNTEDNSPEKLLEDIKEMYPHLASKIKKNDVSPRNFPMTLSNIFTNQIRNSLVNNTNSYHQLFNYVYQDGTPMLTVGGIIQPEKNNKVIDSDEFINIKTDNILKIEAPPLTSKEKKFFDSNIRKIKREIDRSGSIKEFEIETKHVRGYLKYYKYYPEYIESIV